MSSINPYSRFLEMAMGDRWARGNRMEETGNNSEVSPPPLTPRETQETLLY